MTWFRAGRFLRFLAGAAILASAGCDFPDTSGDGSGGGGGGVGGGSGGSGGTTVSGRVTYDFVPAVYSPSTQVGRLDFANAVEKPVRNGVVRVVEGSNVLAATNTDESGNYSLSFNSSGGALTVQALAKTSNPEIRVEDNTDSNLLWAVTGAAPSGNGTLNLHARHGWTGTSYDAAKRIAAPFAILDSMYTASKAFMAVRSVQFPPLKVNWSPDNVPQSGDLAQGFINTSHFSSSDGEIYVLGKAGADSDEFDTHVIVHEWGHYFEANLSRSDSPGGRHGPGDVLDPRIAFGEAWGNALASMVLPETVYTDTVWSGGSLTAFGFDAETEPTPTDDPTPNGFSESSVLRLLFDLYDPANESFDQVSLGLGPIYDVMVGPEKDTDAVTTLASFVAGLKQQSGVNVTAVDSLLARYGVGPVTTGFGDGDTDLRGIFTTAALPYSGTIGLGGGYLPNTWQQNQYYVFQGNGATITVTATSSQDVALAVYQRGAQLGKADANTSGTETVTFSSQSGARYVAVLTGFGTTSGDYNVAVTVQ